MKNSLGFWYVCAPTILISAGLGLTCAWRLAALATPFLSISMFLVSAIFSTALLKSFHHSRAWRIGSDGITGFGLPRGTVDWQSVDQLNITLHGLRASYKGHWYLIPFATLDLSRFGADPKQRQAALISQLSAWGAPVLETGLSADVWKALLTSGLRLLTTLWLVVLFRYTFIVASNLDSDWRPVAFYLPLFAVGPAMFVQRECLLSSLFFWTVSLQGALSIAVARDELENVGRLHVASNDALSLAAWTVTMACVVTTVCRLAKQSRLANQGQ